MHKQSIKFMAIFLIFALMSALLSCTANPQKEQDGRNGSADGENNAAEKETANEEPEAERPNIPDGTNYGGYEFRVLVPDPGYIGVIDEIYAESETGDTMNDAVYKRNRLVENMLDIKINPIIGPSGHWLVDLPVYARKIIQAGDDAFDIADGVYQPPLAFAGCLENLYDIPNMDLTKPWWDQRMIGDLSYKKGQLYYIIGDMGYFGMTGVSCTIFNKNLMADLGLDYPYNAVREGQWTFDEYAKLVKAASRDLDGDGIMDASDQWGSYGNSGTVIWSMLGCGEKIVSLDSGGVPFLNSLSERHIQVVTALSDLTSDANHFLLAENIKGFSDPYDALDAARRESRILFFGSTIAGIPSFRDYEYDFGIIPHPKFNESQKEYCSPATSYSGSSAFSVPVTNPDPERTGMILEALSGYSTDIIIPALMDVALKSKFTRDEESAEMIELILKTKSFDIVMEYGWAYGGNKLVWNDLYWDVYSVLTLKGADTFVSEIEKQLGKSENDLEKFMDTFDEFK